MKEWSLAVSFAVVLAAAVGAAQRGSDSSVRRSAQPDATTVAPPAPEPPEAPLPATTLRVRGTISTYDTKGGILAIDTPNGLLRFPVPAGTRVRHDGHSVDRAELKTLTGFRAAIRYSESGGRTTVESVNVFDTSERTPR